jgi:carbohydrate kinase (thermoresistant glucokinase family)
MIIILMGVSGCGKTSVGKQISVETDIPFIDGDDFHPPKNILKMKKRIPLDDQDRIPWLENLNYQIFHAGPKGCIMACSALKQSYRDTLAKDREVNFIYLKGSRELISKRIYDRTGHYMPPELLDSQFNDLEEPKNAIIIDIHKSVMEITVDILHQLNLLNR